jgi:hypothetical protein
LFAVAAIPHHQERESGEMWLGGLGVFESMLMIFCNIKYIFVSGYFVSDIL